MNEFSKSPPCPQCGGKVADVVYGLPADDLSEAVDRGEVVLGGCCIESDAPDGRCRACGVRLRRRRGGWEIVLEEA